MTHSLQLFIFFDGGRVLSENNVVPCIMALITVAIKRYFFSCGVGCIFLKNCKKIPLGKDDKKMHCQFYRYQTNVSCFFNRGNQFQGSNHKYSCMWLFRTITGYNERNNKLFWDFFSKQCNQEYWSWQPFISPLRQNGPVEYSCRTGWIFPPYQLTGWLLRFLAVFVD